MRRNLEKIASASWKRYSLEERISKLKSLGFNEALAIVDWQELPVKFKSIFVKSALYSKSALTDFPAVYQIERLIEEESTPTDVGGEAFVKKFKDKGRSWWKQLLERLKSEGREDLYYEIFSALRLPQYRLAKKFAADLLDEVRKLLQESNISEEDVISFYKDEAQKAGIVAEALSLVKDGLKTLDISVLRDVVEDVLDIIDSASDSLEDFANSYKDIEVLDDLLELIISEMPDADPGRIILQEFSKKGK